MERREENEKRPEGPRREEKNEEEKGGGGLAADQRISEGPLLERPLLILLAAARVAGQL